MDMFNVVLVEPEIPANTGNIGRTCVLAGARLHLVRPLGFSLDVKTRRRAALLYWDVLDVCIHDSWDAFIEHEFGCKHYAELSQENIAKLHFATKKAKKTYAQAKYASGDYLVFGKESTGLPEQLLAKFSDCCERIPMLSDVDCGFENCSTSVNTNKSTPLLCQDICGNFVDVNSYNVAALNLSNSVAIMLYEALRQTGFENMES